MSKRRALVSMLLLLSSGTLADNFVGQASVIDGDTLEIHGAHIRLWGIDAPESSQLCRGEASSQYRCGAHAANDLSAYIARRPVNCVALSLDPYGRTVATCSVDGADLGEWLVRNGLALDWPRYSKGRGPNAMPSVPVGVSGRAAMSNRGCIVPASARAESPPTVRTTQVSILDELQCEASIHNVRWPIPTFAGGSSVDWATHANQFNLNHLTAQRNEMVAANRELPASGYALEVDGRLKAEFATKDGARAGGEELKRRFPMLQIRIYDAQTNAREEIQIL